jgi:hypothetical protein
MENFTSFLPRRVVSVADVNFAKKMSCMLHFDLGQPPTPSTPHVGRQIRISTEFLRGELECRNLHT